MANATDDEYAVKRPASGCAIYSSAIHSEGREVATIAAAAGSGFYHELKNLGGDPEVMQRATDFVTKILQTKGEGGKDNDQPSHQLQLEHDTQELSKAQYVKSTNLFAKCITRSQRLKPTGATTRCKDRRLRRGRRRNKSSKNAAAGAVETVASGRGVSKRAKDRGENETALLNLSERQQRHLQQQQQEKCSQPGDTAVCSASRCAFPFPPGGTDRGLDKQVVDDGETSKVSESNTERLAANGVAADDVTKPKESSSLGLTPLAFDVFCSLRPTLLKDNSTKQGRQNPPTATAAKVIGMPNSARGERQIAARERCRRLTPRGQSRPFSAAAAPSLRDLAADSTAACTWTSVFGAVCAGAERGRARAEVLKAARRASSRSNQRQRRAAAPAAIATTVADASKSSSPRMNLVSDCGTTAFGVDAVGFTEDGRKTVDREKYDAVDPDMNDNSGGKPSVELSVEILGDVICPLQALETKSESASLGQQLKAEKDDDLNCNSISDLRMFDVVGAESCAPLPSDGCHNRLPEETDAGHPMKHEGSAMAASPLFRHPFGGGTTLIGVNAPRSLQLCPGDNGFNGLGSNISRHCFYFSRRQRGRDGRLTRQSSPRRPSTASAALWSGRTTSGTTNGCGEREVGAGPGMAAALQVRPETAGSFFSVECSPSKQGMLGDAPWTNQSENR